MREYRVIKRCADYLLQGDPHVAILLIHGFHGSNTEIKPLAEYFWKKLGYTVRVLRLPGHGTHVTEMAQITNEDYLKHIRDEFKHLREHYHVVGVAGFSMGALLAANLAARMDVDILVLLAPSIYILKKKYSQKGIKILAWILSFLWPFLYKFEKNNFYDKRAAHKRYAYASIPMTSLIELFNLIDKTKQLLSRIQCPTLIIHSRSDNVVAPESSEFVYEMLGTNDKELVWVDDSSHVLCLDQKKDKVIVAAGEFIKKHLMNWKL